MIEVVMATYNGARWLSEQLESIAGQTLPVDSVLVRDDGSSDSTLAVLERAKGNGLPVRVISPGGARLGAAANFDCILQKSQADYVFLADQDDYWDPLRASRMMAAMRRAEAANPGEPVLVFGRMLLMDESGALLDKDLWVFRRMDPKRMSRFRACYQSGGIPGCAMLLNRALLKKALPVPEQAVMHDFWMQLVATAFGQVVYVENATTVYRLHESNAVGLIDSSARALLGWALKRPLISLRHVRTHLARSQAQAEVFLTRYGAELSHDYKRELAAYVALKGQPYLQRKAIALRHRWHRAGVLRTMAFYAAL